MMQPQPSKWLYDFLKTKERFRPSAYAATPNELARGIWTIGYGHTAGVKEGDTCTMDQALTWLISDVQKFYSGMIALVKVQLNQNQVDGLTSLVFNIGVGKRDGKKGDFADSTLLDKLNRGDFAGAQAEFTKWDHQNGRWMRGLDIRRDEEAARFGTPC